MQKVIRHCTKFSDERGEELLKDFLTQGWKVIKMETTSCSNGQIVFFQTVFVLEK
jgi:hypothetical protein